VNVRIITATNRNLEKVAEGRFRSDLLQAECFPIHLPALREKEDIPLLADYFREITKTGKKINGFSQNVK
jgi:transcriptional regulator with GAF, ATPase, and Fis domain